VNESVPEAGIEPALPYGKQILSLSCLPIPPLGHWTRCIFVTALLFCSCVKGKQNPTEGVDYQQLQQAQKLWMQGLDGPFMEIVDAQRVGREIFFAVAAKAFAERGRVEWSIVDLERSQQYALKCLAEDYHFRILLRNERGILTLKAVQALDMNNTSLVECAKWLTVSGALKLHHTQLLSAERDIELLNAIAEWLKTTPQLTSDPWIDYAHILSEVLKPAPNWVWVREQLDQIADMDDLMAFERVMLERRIDTERFCQTDIVQYPKLSVGQLARWQDAQYLCFKP
jgi:hypothetical protein